MNMLFPFLAFAILCACGSNVHPDIRDIADIAPDKQYVLELTDVGLALTLPNQWTAQADPGGPAITLSRPNSSVRMRLQILNMPAPNRLEAYLDQQRRLITQGKAGSYVRTSPIEDLPRGRRGFTMDVAEPGRPERLVNLIFAPMPGRVDQIVCILISGAPDDVLRQRDVTRFIYETIRPIGQDWADITAPGSS